MINAVSLGEYCAVRPRPRYMLAVCRFSGRRVAALPGVDSRAALDKDVPQRAGHVHGAGRASRRGGLALRTDSAGARRRSEQQSRLPGQGQEHRPL